MKTDFRNRALLPVLIPLGILAAIAAFVGLFAWILLYNTKDGALALAAVMATGVLVAISLAASADELDGRRRAGVLLAIGGPIIAGMILAGTGGGVDDVALLNINREPITVIPEIHVTIAANNSNSFEQTRLMLPADTEAAVIFENNEANVPHNFAFALAGPGGTAPAALEPIGASPVEPGVNESFLALQEAAGTYWFWCQVHSNMNGILELAEGAEPSAS